MKKPIVILSIITMILFLGNVNMYAVNSGKKNLESIEKEMTKKEKKTFVKETKKKVKEFLKTNKTGKEKSKAEKIAIGALKVLGIVALSVLVCLVILYYIIVSSFSD